MAEWVDPPVFVAGQRVTDRQLQTISGDLRYLFETQAVQIRKTSFLTCTSGTRHNIDFDTVDYDTDGMWDPLNPTFITIQQSGLYLLSALVRWAPAIGAERLVEFGPPGTSSPDAILQQFVAGSSGNGRVSNAALLAINAVAGYEIEMRIMQNTGANLDAEAHQSSLVLSAHRFGPPV